MKLTREEIIAISEKFWHDNYGMDANGREYILKSQFEKLLRVLRELKAELTEKVGNNKIT